MVLQHMGHADYLKTIRLHRLSEAMRLFQLLGLRHRRKNRERNDRQGEEPSTLSSVRQ
jgi:hypothetical protein